MVDDQKYQCRRCNSRHTTTESCFEVRDARYAEKQKAVHCTFDNSGFKTRAMRLCEALNGRYSNRERAYIMSARKAERLVSLFEAGYDAGFLSRELIAPKGTMRNKQTRTLTLTEAEIDLLQRGLNLLRHAAYELDPGTDTPRHAPEISTLQVKLHRPE